jgi:D-glycero-D-manno-heptose 1,7-bisphosphate phosphatase
MKIENVILDRDGVINEDSDAYIKSPEEFIFIEKSIEAIIALKQNNINIFIATNQSGINRGLYNLTTFFDINTKLINTIKKYSFGNIHSNNNVISGIYYCPHTPEQTCTCRKPLPGMITKIKINHNINLNTTAFIGDSMRDLEAAIQAGCAYQYLVRTGKGINTAHKYKKNLNPNNIFDNLYDCVAYILKNNI